MLIRTLLHRQNVYPQFFQYLPHSLHKTPGVGYPAFQKGASASRLVGLATAMNSQAVTTVLSTRCSHRTTSGRQCRQLAADPQSGVCSHHRAVQKQMEANDLSDTLLARSQNFQTAQGVNFALANIYRLLAANRISPRRASVLAYINSLLLRTLPAIDYDQENGHTDPTASGEDETEEDSSETNVEDLGTTTAPNDASPNAKHGWDASIPEPDLTRKPS
jgi:hypothetical protein